MKAEIPPNPKIWKCTSCTKEFKYESEMRRHEQSHVPQFQCKVCSKTFSFVSALRRHEKQHERTEPVQCIKCGGNFRDATLLKRHIQYAHTGTYTCNKCNAIFNSEYALKTHLKTHKPESERRYRCSFTGCTKAFNFPHHLKHHELTHTDSKQFFCKECGKGFIQSHHLKIHQKTHEPESWLPCVVPDCKKKFINEYARKRHLAIHKKRLKSEGTFNSNTSMNRAITKPKKLKEDKIQDGYALCGELVTSCEEHISKSPVREVTEEPCLTLNNEYNKRIKVETENQYDKSVISCDQEVDKLETKTSTCRTALGSCLVDGDSEGTCLCAQMADVEECSDEIIPTENETTSHAVKLTDNNLSMNDLDKNKCNGDMNMCDSCECASICASFNNDTDETPEIEYRIDGTVKIKQTCDIETNIKSENRLDDTELNIIDIKNDMKDLKLVPFNSCKDILGNCIVSGTSTIGEGCLCAKMAMDDNQIIAQEIEDITPCPKSAWLH